MEYPPMVTLCDSDIMCILRAGCGCKKNACFATVGPDQTPVFQAIKHSRSEVYYLSAVKTRDKIREIIVNSAIGPLNVRKARLKLKFYIGSRSAPDAPHRKICKRGFCRVHGITEHTLRQIILDIKQGVKRTMPDFRDRCKVPADILKYIKSHLNEEDMEKKGKICPSALERRMTIAAGHKSMAAAEWMSAYFEMMGKLRISYK